MSHTTSTDHAAAAAEFIADRPRTHWHDGALWFVRAKRDKAAQSLPEWESLREAASQIKAHTVSRLADYLEQFERNATRLGATVHWARDAAEHNQIVLELLQRHGAKRVVKSKSMLTEECHLNPFLERHGIEVVDTDLGERIVQLAGEPPSHIVLPAIHKKKEDVAELFHRHLHTDAGASDPIYLAEAARQHLREKFMQADAGLTGVNFAVAETGGFVVCTNEGNADLGVSLPNAPANFGSYQFFCVLGLSVFDIEKVTATGFSFFAFVGLTLPVAFFGFLAVLRSGLSMRSMREKLTTLPSAFSSPNIPG